MGIFLVEGFVKTVPIDLEEAAAIRRQQLHTYALDDHFSDLPSDPRDGGNHSGIQLLE